MTTVNGIGEQKRVRNRSRLLGTMQCLCSGDQFKLIDREPASRLQGDVPQLTLDSVNIEEAESSLRESGCLNYEEARALLGRYEYQRGNTEAALHVFEGIDASAVSSKMKLTLARRLGGHNRKHSQQSDDTPPLSINAVTLLFEAFFLKAKSLQALGKFVEAAQSCKLILDIVESALPDGLPNNLGNIDSRLQETLTKAIELLPELWKLSDSPQEAILSYRRALLRHWNLDTETTSRIQKAFAIYLLYSGEEAKLPDLRSQIHSSFVPKNNLEEAILLLMLLLKKAIHEVIEWDPMILELLSFALSVCGSTCTLASLVEELLPGVIDRQERYHTLALCYYGNDDGFAALNLLRKMLSSRTQDKIHFPALLMASKICGENSKFSEEGIGFAQRAIENMEGQCNQMMGTAHFLLGISLSEYARSAVADSERIARQSMSIDALQKADQLTESQDPEIVYQLSLQYAEQRKLDLALQYAKRFMKIESGSSIKGWILLARILSAEKRYLDAETVIDAALEQTDSWDQGEPLRTKAKIQTAQGHLNGSLKTYTQLLATLKLQSEGMEPGKRHIKGIENRGRNFEVQTMLDLAEIYICLAKWSDAEICLAKAKAINPHSAIIWHVTGSLYDAKGQHKKALQSFTAALSIDPSHVPSLISSAVAMRRLDKTSQTFSAARSFLMNALSIDRMNHPAWHNLGLLYKEEGRAAYLIEAADCFEAAAALEETAPVEPFR